MSRKILYLENDQGQGFQNEPHSRFLFAQSTCFDVFVISGFCFENRIAYMQVRAKLNFGGPAGAQHLERCFARDHEYSTWLVETEIAFLCRTAILYKNKGGANRGETARRICEKLFYKNQDISRLRSQKLMKSFQIQDFRM